MTRVCPPRLPNAPKRPGGPLPQRVIIIGHLELQDAARYSLAHTATRRDGSWIIAVTDREGGNPFQVVGYPTPVAFSTKKMRSGEVYITSSDRLGLPAGVKFEPIQTSEKDMLALDSTVLPKNKQALIVDDIVGDSDVVDPGEDRSGEALNAQAVRFRDVAPLLRSGIRKKP